MNITPNFKAIHKVNTQDGKSDFIIDRVAENNHAKKIIEDTDNKCVYIVGVSDTDKDFDIEDTLMLNGYNVETRDPAKLVDKDMCRKLFLNA